MKNKILFRITGYIVLFIVFSFLFSYILPQVILYPQEYLFGSGSGIFVYGFFCVGIGAEINAYITKYWYYDFLDKKESKKE